MSKWDKLLMIFGRSAIEGTEEGAEKLARDAAAKAAQEATEAAGREAAEKAAREAAEQAGTKAVQETAEQAAQRAARETVEGMMAKKDSFMNRFVMRSLKVGLVAGGARETLILTEYFSGGAISSVADDVVYGVAGALQAISPAMAEAVKEHGLAALALASGISATERNAGVNVASEILVREGQDDAAAAIRITNALISLEPYLLVADTEKENRAEVVIDQICERAKVDRDQLATFLADHPRMLETLESYDIDLTASLPLLAEKRRQAEELAAEQNQTGADASASAARNDLRQRATETIGQVRDSFSSATMPQQLKDMLGNLWNVAGNNKGAMLGGALLGVIGFLSGENTESRLLGMVALGLLGAVVGYFANKLLSSRPDFQAAASGASVTDAAPAPRPQPVALNFG